MIQIIINVYHAENGVKNVKIKIFAPNVDQVIYILTIHMYKI